MAPSTMTTSTTSKNNKNTATSIIIVSKTGTLSETHVIPENDTTIDELTKLLSKKCGYRNHDGFTCYHTYKYKNKKKFSFSLHNEDITPKYIYVDVWAKNDGRAGNENKYELPPPIDELIFYGNIALVARLDKETTIDITIELWNTIYEKLFGGFEDLAATAIEDENEIDELDAIPLHKKTSNGYLKDGFIVDDDSEDKTPRCKKHLKGRGKKNKSESTESEFITETETESASPPSGSDAEADIVVPPVIECNIIIKKTTKSSKIKRGATKSKNIVEEPVISQESESELSEEEYVT
jgi:hypothetical protein